LFEASTFVVRLAQVLASKAKCEASRGFKILFKLKSIKNFDYFIFLKKGKLVVIDLQPVKNL
jgi:hypothetical protein